MRGIVASRGVAFGEAGSSPAKPSDCARWAGNLSGDSSDDLSGDLSRRLVTAKARAEAGSPKAEPGSLANPNLIFKA